MINLQGKKLPSISESQSGLYITLGWYEPSVKVCNGV